MRSSKGQRSWETLRRRGRFCRVSRKLGEEGSDYLQQRIEITKKWRCERSGLVEETMSIYLCLGWRGGGGDVGG